MGTARCDSCKRVLIRYGRTSSGAQRWRCKSCGMTKVQHIDTRAKDLHAFTQYLLSNQRQVDMPGAGRTFRRRYQRLWSIWPMSPIVDEIYDVIYVDGIHLGRKAVVLIAQTDEHVLAWYVARAESAHAWHALLERIAPPRMVVCDGGNGIDKTLRRLWPNTKVQRCRFHVFMNIRQATTSKPKLPAAQELLNLGIQLLHANTQTEARQWLSKYSAYLHAWHDFLHEKTTLEDGSIVDTHYRLVKATRLITKLIHQQVLFTFLDEQWDEPMPATNNRIEGATNAPLRQMLRNHRGMSLIRRIKAIFWWCYKHSAHQLSDAQIIKTMPTDQDIEAHYQRLHEQDLTKQHIPGWGTALVWQELHHTTPYTNTWD